jgi:glycosyltransferase involved in cell wall biosynthesis
VRVHYLPIKNFYFPFDGRARGKLRKACWHILDSYNPLAALAVGRILDQEGPDLVHTHNLAGFSVSVWAAVKRRGLPLIHTLHDQYLLCARSTMFRSGRNCSRQCSSCRVLSQPRRHLSEVPDVVAGPTRFIIERHVAFGYFQGVKHAVVPYAVEAPAFGRRRSGVGDENQQGMVNFGFLGRVDPSKGVAELVNAFLGLPAGSAHLHIAGRGPRDYVERVRTMAAGRTEIHWLGFVRPEALLSQIDVLVVPSLWQDTAPTVVLEAIACGIPVLGSKRGGIPELVPHGGGWIYDPDEPGALESALQECIARRDRLPIIGQVAAKAAHRYTEAAQLEGYRAAYEVAGLRW